MSKIKKSDLNFIRTTFMILLFLLSFMVGYAVGITRYSTITEKSVTPQIRIVPNESHKAQRQFIKSYCNHTRKSKGVVYER